MTKEKYIKKCKVKNAKGLTANQIIEYFISGNGGIVNRISATFIKTGGGFGVKIDRAKAVAMMRQAFEQDKELEISFVDGEGVITEEEKISSSHFVMRFLNN